MNKVKKLTCVVECEWKEGAKMQAMQGDWSIVQRVKMLRGRKMATALVKWQLPKAVALLIGSFESLA